MGERPNPQVATSDWNKPFVFPFSREDQTTIIVTVEPTVKDYRIYCDGLILTGTELASLVYTSFGLNCKEVAKKVDRTDRRIRVALEQAKNRNRLGSRDELLAKAEELGILSSSFFTGLKQAADRHC